MQGNFEKIWQNIWRTCRKCVPLPTDNTKQDRKYADGSSLLVVAWFDDSIVAKHEAFICHTERKKKEARRNATGLFSF